MTSYSLLNFLHVIFSIGIVVSIAIERLMMIKLLKARTPEQLKTWRDLYGLPFKIGAPSVSISLLTGIYLAVTMWPRTPWIWPSILALLFYSLAGGTFATKSYKILINSASAEEMASAWGKLWFSLQLRTGLLIGIIYLMVAKPLLNESIAALIFFIVAFTVPVAFFRKKYKAQFTQII